MHMGQELAALAQDHIGADDAKRADRHILSDDSPRFDPGAGVDRAHSRPHDSRAPTSASATSCPATMASPRNHHMFLFRAILVMWYSIVSPGRTGLRNFALSMVRKKTLGAASWLGCDRRQIAPAVCAIPSINSTPGNTGFPGK